MLQEVLRDKQKRKRANRTRHLVSLISWKGPFHSVLVGRNDTFQSPQEQRAPVIRLTGIRLTGECLSLLTLGQVGAVGSARAVEAKRVEQKPRGQP